MIEMKTVLLFIVVITAAVAQKNPHFTNGRTVIVHLFEWKWNDIADECERFLAPNGYAGVQVSPVHECTIVQNRPWYERYQPVSYSLTSRSGDENDFSNMVRRCKAVGVNIYVDVVFNHMAAQDSVGTGGNWGSVTDLDYPAVPYGPSDFNNYCDIDYNDFASIRNCWLVSMPDLNQGKPWVQDKISEAMNHLVDLGVAGFRIDVAKHMWPADLSVIFGKLKNLNTNLGFPENARPFIYQEVHEPIPNEEYTSLGAVTEFKHSNEIGRVFRGRDQLKYLENWGTGWGFVPSQDAVVFVDNHDNQREHSGEDGNILTYKQSKRYKMATSFELAHPYGITRIMSSFDFVEFDQGPPNDGNGNINSPTINADGTCGGGWVCEHRWRQMFNMVQFRNIAGDAPLANWYSNGGNAIAFSRGDRAFIALSQETSDFTEVIATGMAAGLYCDIISGSKYEGSCSGKSFTVGTDGRAKITIEAVNSSADSVVAFTVDSRL